MLNALRHRDFRIYWIGNTVSFMGTWLQNTAMSWLVRSLTASPFYLGLVAFCGTAPMFFLSLFGGVLADRMDKRRVILVTQFSLGLFAGILAYLTISHRIRLLHIMLIALASGVAAAMDGPFRQSFVYHLVGRDDLPAAIAMNSISFNGARIVGPAIAGVLIARWGQGVCFGLNAISFGAVLIALLFLTVDTSPVNDGSTSVWADLTSGLHYIRRMPEIRGVILLVAIPSFLSFSYHSMLPIFARDILHRNAAGFGLMLSAQGVGALCAAALLPSVTERFGRGHVLLSALAFFGVAETVLALSRTYHLTLLAMAGAGFGFVLFIASANSALQLLSSEEMRGRVVGAYVFTSIGLSPVGNLIIGTFAEMASPQTAVAVGGVLAFALSAFTALWQPHLRRL